MKGQRPLDTARLFRLVLGPERTFYGLILLYAIATGALGLSVPLSVQVLIGTVVNSALHNQVVILAGMLFALLLLAGVFIALQVYLMELFERRFFSRVVSEVTLRLVYARLHHMQSINRDDLVNRYFDIMTVQKSLPPLITGGLATLLQSLVGITVTSFYHPVFFGFNIAVVLLAYLIFRLFDRPAARSGLALSTTKYDTANWLESLARSNAFFKSGRTIEYALARTRAVRAEYVQRHARHFRYTFSQVIGFLLLYALASATLLGLGGWLVIAGQLTIGQLVAAELILAAIFYGLTRLGYYLELYYDLYAAVHKLLQLYELPAELVREVDGIDAWRPDLRLADVRCDAGGRALHFDFAVAAGHRALLVPRSTTQVEAICNLLQHHESAPSGQILLGGHDVEDFNAQRLRDDVHVLDATPFPECTVAEYLAIADPRLSRARMRALLDIVGLDVELPEVARSLEAQLTPYGYPLSTTGATKLRIAFALAACPRVLVLTPAFDMLRQEARRSVMRYLATQADMTVLCFSHRRDLPLFDDYILVDFTRQTRFADIGGLFDAYDRAVAQTLPADPSVEHGP